MASKECEERFRAFFECIGRSDGPAIAGHLTESVRWWFPPSAADRADVTPSVAALLGHVPRRPEQGRDSVLRVIGHVDHFYRHLEYTLEHVLEDGDMVAVHATARGVTAVGREYRNEYHFLFRMEGGRIAEGWEFLDTAFIYARNATATD